MPAFHTEWSGLSTHQTAPSPQDWRRLGAPPHLTKGESYLVGGCSACVDFRLMDAPNRIGNENSGLPVVSEELFPNLLRRDVLVKVSKVPTQVLDVKLVPVSGKASDLSAHFLNPSQRVAMRSQRTPKINIASPTQ